MEQIINTLLSKLTNKGLAPQEVVRVVRDVLTIVNDGGEFTVADINQKLVNLGWKEQIMDEFTFELIISLMENDCNYQIMRYNLH
jgi:hypothetical protein